MYILCTFVAIINFKNHISSTANQVTRYNIKIVCFRNNIHIQRISDPQGKMHDWWNVVWCVLQKRKKYKICHKRKTWRALCLYGNSRTKDIPSHSARTHSTNFCNYVDEWPNVSTAKKIKKINNNKYIFHKVKWAKQRVKECNAYLTLRGTVPKLLTFRAKIQSKLGAHNTLSVDIQMHAWLWLLWYLGVNDFCGRGSCLATGDSRGSYWLDSGRRDRG